MTARKLLAPSALIGVAAVMLACAKDSPRPEGPEDRQRTVLVGEPVQTTIDDPLARMQSQLVPEPMFACVTDEDCTVVEMGCCDYCNGGWQMSVNSKRVDEAIQTWHEPDCETEACTRMACEQSLSPVCDGGICARREEEPSMTGEVRISIIRNVLPPR